MRKKNQYVCRLVVCISFLLILSALITFIVLINSNSVVSKEMIFSDIAMDHPVYTLFPGLIKNGSIKTGYNVRMEPFRQITADEWNHALKRNGGCVVGPIPSELLFKDDSEINSESVEMRLLMISGGDCKTEEIVDTSRIAVFYRLEKVFWGERLS